MAEAKPNALYYGDNLDVLRRYIPDACADLVYLDPPFKSNQDYNVLFKEQDGARAAAQIKAFEDTWRWDEAAAAAYEDVVAHGPERVSRAMQAFRAMLGTNDMLAYLAMMAPRLVELRRVLKDAGSLYLHCDPVASHYLKMLLDGVFGGAAFRNEIVWRRTTSHSDARGYGCVHDTTLFYRCTPGATWNEVLQSHDQEYIESYYRYKDEDGRRWMSSDLSGAGPGPERAFGERGAIAPPRGRHWMYDQAGIDRLLSQGRIFFTLHGVPRLKKYLDENPGMPTTDVWTDILPLRSWHTERLGYPTQKPEALLKRIILASSNEGGLVLDPFCGCGTAVVAAQRLKRRWIGIDITHLAITLMKHRLRDAFGPEIESQYSVTGEPTTLQDAAALAALDPFQFQYWALGLVGARPHEKKKGADRGIDGRLFWVEDPKGAKSAGLIISVKSGKPHITHVRELAGTLEREKAVIGVLLTLAEPTQPMRAEAAAAGHYESATLRKSYPRLQILTITELLEGKGIRYPHEANVTFNRATPSGGAGGGAKRTPLFGPE